MRTQLKTHLPAVACALTPVLCYLIIRPYAEIGMDDDWSYIKTVQVLAQTGHIAYNGWATAMLGWQLYLGALFVKLFGFSFTTVRLSTLLEAAATAFLLQRSLVRAGVNEWNATWATLAFNLSPLYIPLTVTFMSDVSGMLCIVLCLYMCLRALEAQSQISAMLWISLAALLNGVGGSARQIAWLGVLVMVPSTLWLLRRDRRVLVTGAISCIAGDGMVYAAMRWFKQQPYSIPEPLLYGKLDLEAVRNLGFAALMGVGELALLLVPVLLMVKVPQRKIPGRKAAVLASGCRGCVLLGFILWALSRMSHHSVPFLGDHLAFLQTQTPVLIPVPALWLLALGMAGLVLVSLAASAPGEADSVREKTVSWQELGVLLAPYSCAYILLLVPRSANGLFLDRYLLPLAAVALLALTRYYQQTVKAKLPIACVALILLAGSVGVVATHNKFALYRGYVAALHEIRARGVPATDILGVWEFDCWTQVEKVGHVNDARIRIPQGAFTPPRKDVIPANCDQDLYDNLDVNPVITPVYIVSKDPIACGAPAAFPTVTYRKWPSPHALPIYIAKLPVSSSH